MAPLIRSAVVLLLLLPACSAFILEPSDSAGVKTRKVLSRIALDAGTAGLAEVFLIRRHREMLQEQDLAAWRDNLRTRVASGELTGGDAAILDALHLQQLWAEAAANQARWNAVGQAVNQAGQNFNNAMRTYQPPVYMPPPRPMNCITNSIGATLYTNCY